MEIEHVSLEKPALPPRVPSKREYKKFVKLVVQSQFAQILEENKENRELAAIARKKALERKLKHLKNTKQIR